VLDLTCEIIVFLLVWKEPDYAPPLRVDPQAQNHGVAPATPREYAVHCV
jgi:hypothetical protein